MRLQEREDNLWEPLKIHISSQLMELLMRLLMKPLAIPLCHQKALHSHLT